MFIIDEAANEGGLTQPSRVECRIISLKYAIKRQERSKQQQQRRRLWTLNFNNPSEILNKFSGI